MVQNLKVDILYYDTPIDYELEFNLCGSCPIRLMTDKVSSPNEFVQYLANTVKRSRVIICSGKLFGENGLINIISRATGIAIERINNNDFGIEESGETDVIKESLPLVYNGIFGGCIIECGPQSIIIISDNKSLRKNIMNEFIHKYLVAVSRTPINQTAADSLEEIKSKSNSDEEPSDNGITDKQINPEENQPVEEVFELSENNADVNTFSEVLFPSENDEENSEDEYLHFSKENSELDVDIDFGKPWEDDFQQDDNDGYYINADDDEYDDDDITTERMNQSKKNKSNRGLKTAVLILLIVFLLLCGIMAYLIVYLPMVNGTSLSESINEIISFFKQN